MANAFSPGRVSLWHTSLRSFLPNYSAYKDLGVTDIFLDAAEATVQRMGEIRGKPSADGRNFRAQLYVDGTHGEGGAELAEFALKNIGELKPGVIEPDFEAGDDNFLGVAVRDFHQAFRLPDQPAHWRNAFPICINVVPMKGYVLPWQLLNNDPNCYVRVQRYYGAECRPAEPTLCREDIVGRGFPSERFSFMESAKPRKLSDGTLFVDLPVFSDGGVRVRNLSGGAIFDSNFLRQAGLA